jgi:MFS family permease
MKTSAILRPKYSWALLLPWAVWLVSSLFVTFQMLLQTSPSVMIADLQQAFQVDTLGVSLLSSSFFYTYMLFQIPSGMLIDRVQPRYCLMACLVGIAAMSMVFASATSLHMAKLSRILQGMFSAPSVVPALYLAASWFPARRFALLAGLTEMVGMLGAAAGQAFLAPCVSSMGWRHTTIACAFLGLALAVLTWAIVRDKPVQEKANDSIKQKTHFLRDLQTVISYPQAWINGICCGLLFAIAAAFGSFWCIPYLMHTYPISLNLAAAASSMTLFGVALGAPVLGAVSDKMGLRKLPILVSTGLVLALMLIILYVPVVKLPLMFILLFLLGFFSSAYALPFAVMRDIVPENVRGTAMGYTNLMCILIGAPVLQPLIGWLLKLQLLHTANQALAYERALTVIPICLAIAFALAFFIKETYCGIKQEC